MQHDESCVQEIRITRVSFVESISVKRKLPFIIIGAVLVLALAGAEWFYRSRTPKIVLTTKAGAPGAQPPQVVGANQPRVTIEEFGDFQCPPCGKLHPVLKKAEEDYPSLVAIVFREFPMTQLHANALEAARAAEAAGVQGAFWPMHDFMYDTQEMWSNWRDVRSVFARQATIMGFDPKKLRNDMDSAEVQQRIAADQQRGQSLGVIGTPTVFLNGRMVAPEELEHLRELIDAALK
jgi:protein-disulfide isomerase